MRYSNSSLVAYTLLSPNHSGLRTEQIDRISPHCVVGQCTAEGLGDWFHKSSTQASSNYGIDRNGRVGLYVEEKNRSWCTSSNANDQRAVTIECASDKVEPYAMHQVVYDRLIDLCEDICRRNGKKKLLWFGDKNKSLNYQRRRMKCSLPCTGGLRIRAVLETGFMRDWEIWLRRLLQDLAAEMWK